MPVDPANTSGWSVVLPVKSLARAKSRLAARPAAERTELARAFALDVLGICLATPAVHQLVVVTDDPSVAAPARAVGAVVVADPPAEHGRSGLNGALRHGAALAIGRRPDLAVALLTADLPALRVQELSLALERAAGHQRAFVGDASGTGTTLLCTAKGIEPDPLFGVRSRAAHASAGAIELTGRELARLRCDVDTEVDLWLCAALGVGPHTSAVLGRVPGAGADRPIDDHGPELVGTVRSFDAEQLCGSVFLDDGSWLPFDAAAFRAGRLRLLRPGQRVRLRTTGTELSRVVTALTLVTFGWDEPVHD